MNRLKIILWKYRLQCSIIVLGDIMKRSTGTSKTAYQNASFGRRGMGLEEEINLSNQYYLEMNKAVIYKKPTPITITKVNYPSRMEAVIKEAYFKTPSTTDYNGIYKGKYIDFEAKETKNVTAFPLINIHAHQINHLKRITEHGGIGFLIVRFSKTNQTFYLSYEKLNQFLENEKRKSIPIQYFQEHGHPIKDTYQPRIDYLKIVDLYIEGGKKWKKSKNFYSIMEPIYLLLL